MNAVVQNPMPTLSQLRGWESEHLIAASQRWNSAIGTWTSTVGAVAAGLPDPAGTAWDGPASQAAGVRVSRDEAAVQTVADRLRLGMRIAQHGAGGIALGRQRALEVVAMADALGFDVHEDLSVVDRGAIRDRASAATRARQGLLLTANLKAGAAQLAAFDQQVASDLDMVTEGFDVLDLGQHPALPPIEEDAVLSFSQCWTKEFKEQVGPSMVQSAFIGGAWGALTGAAAGLAGGPLGVAGGLVVGFVGGAAQGAMFGGPGKAAARAAVDCV